MEEKVYWTGVEQLDPTVAARSTEKEFADELPALGAIIEPLVTTGETSRRDFLKMLGFSTAAAVVAAGCELPVRKSIPYALKPEEITPGIANYYASVFHQGGDYCPVVVKTREGRPIKIEGNKLSTMTNGGTSARVQASVLSLYDGARHKGPRRGKENITWEVADNEIGAKLKAIKESNGKIVLFSSTIPSPSTQAAITEFKTAYNAEHLIADGISYSAILDANEKNFGQRAIPSYHFEKAKLIVGIGCDFLGTWLSPVQFAGAWATNRKVTAEKPQMSRHIQIESALTITGSSADMRVPVRPADEAMMVVEIHKALHGSSSNPKATAVAKELMEAKGNALVVCGINDPNVQMVVNAINQTIESYGSTISWASTLNTKQGSDIALAQLIEGLDKSEIKAVIFYQSNPLFTHHNATKLAEALKKATLSVSFSDRRDETSEVCGYICPDSHWLESWNDYSPQSGTYHIAQPVIHKLFDTRQAQETLLKWSGKDEKYYDFIRTHWDKNIYTKQSKYSGFNALWDVTVHDGELVTESNGDAKYAAGDVDTAASSIATMYGAMGDTQVKLFESVAIGDGYWADNPFLQELPDGVTKTTWGNYVMCSMAWAKRNNIKNDVELKDYQIVKVTVGDKSVELPAIAVPGVADGTFAIALGYGRKVTAHKELEVGQSAAHLLTMLGTNVSYINKATVTPVAREEKVAITQAHHNITLMGLGGVKRRKVVKETTLAEYAQNPAAGNEDREKIMEEMVTLYYEHKKVGHHWTMSVDLNSCIGCGACVTACNVENNVPVVGKDQVIRSREMHWLRIDRYFTYTDMIAKGTETLPAEKIDVVFQPLMCQHCDNAPCENVCPVAATNHSSEGLNQMAYNRCIGTRYCANNCPYKVRRFNWYDYQGADAFDKRVGSMWANEGLLSGITREQQEPMSRMVLNPDVTVRSRGVIEKCSFCVQRIQEGKLTAKKENRPLRDGDVVSACQTACPTNAISFGDRNDKESIVAQAVTDERAFGVIEEIHTMPNVLYMTKVRNRNEVKA